MENTCGFCAHQDQSVVALQEDYSTGNPSIVNIAARHLWFTNEELKSFYICDACRNKLLEFHHFYCQIRQLYSGKPIVNENKLESVPTNADQIELKSVTIQPESVEVDEEILSDGNDDDDDHEEPADATRNENSNEKLPEDQPSEEDPRLAITDEDIRIYCQMKCHICSEEFDYYEDLKAHCTREHDSKCYVYCCNTRLDRLDRVKDHILFHLKPDIFRCEKCDKNLTTKGNLSRHLKSAGHLFAEDQVFGCGFCTKKCPSQEMLNDHMQSHQKKTTIHKCDLCPKEFTTFARLACHMGMVHKSTDLPQSCKVCHKKFDSRETLNAHRDSSRCFDLQLDDPTPGPSGRKCTICDEVFHRKAKYREHIALHAGQLLYACDFCGKPFRTSSTMQWHRRHKHPKEWKKLKLKPKYETAS